MTQQELSILRKANKQLESIIVPGRVERSEKIVSILSHTIGLLEALLPDEPETKPLQSETTSDHQTLFVDCVLPSKEELEKQFDWVSSLWDGRMWTVDKDSNTASGNRTFYMKHFNETMTSEKVKIWADANGYRCANHLETLAYAMANPEDQKKFYYVGLGSFAMSGDDRCVACLGGHAGGRWLHGYCLVRGWGDGCRFLLVRK